MKKVSYGLNGCFWPSISMFPEPSRTVIEWKDFSVAFSEISLSILCLKTLKTEKILQRESIHKTFHH